MNRFWLQRLLGIALAGLLLLGGAAIAVESPPPAANTLAAPSSLAVAGSYDVAPVRGVKQVSPKAIELSVVLTTRAGQQWEAQRALLRRLVVALQRQGIVLASDSVAVRA